MRANVIAVVFAAALVLSINAADTHDTHHHNESHHISTCHASHVTLAEATHIIKKINDLRDKVASGHVFKNITASNMKAIHWDHHLAESSRLYAGRCQGNNSHHDTRHGLHGEHHHHGIKEVTFVATSKCEHFKHAIFDKAFEIWEKGHSHLDHIHINSYHADHNEERILSQLIWAETGHIGCGYANSEVVHGTKEYKQVIVCQFQAAGNQKGHPIFKVGTPCAHCQAGHKCDAKAHHPHLCANQTDLHTHLDPHHWATHHNQSHDHHDNHTRNVSGHVTLKNCSASHFDDSMKTSFVDALNAERERVASGKATPLPSSGNMGQLSWSTTLEASATKWAQRCHYSLDIKHVHHLNISEVVFGMSAKSAFTKFNDKAALAALFRGHEHINATLVNKFAMTTKEANIYAQILWAKSKQVGCAFSNLIEEVGTPGSIIKKEEYIQVLVCHFTEQGDHPGQPIYEVGQNCNHCATGKCSDKYPHLCPL